MAVRRFDRWFAGSYDRLLRGITVYHPVDKDAFHDAYICSRLLISRGDKDFEDYTSFFFACYKRSRLKRSSLEGRFYHPDNYYFQNIPREDTRGSTGKQQDAYQLAHDILEHVRSNFTRQEYRLFCMKTAFPGCSYRELSLYTGIPCSTLHACIQKIKRTVSREKSFTLRNQYLTVV